MTDIVLMIFAVIGGGLTLELFNTGLPHWASKTNKCSDYAPRRAKPRRVSSREPQLKRSW
jgi:hypothetical protein